MVTRTIVIITLHVFICFVFFDIRKCTVIVCYMILQVVLLLYRFTEMENAISRLFFFENALKNVLRSKTVSADKAATALTLP
jgi:hypothetical protein